jgi:uncharacterized membrane protein
MMSLRFVSQYPPAITLGVALLLSLVAWWLYRRELRKLDLGSASWWLPTLRSLAIFLIVLTLAEPIVESRKREGQPGRVLFLLDASESMASLDGGNNTRFERATEHLIHPIEGILPQLSSEFEVSVRSFGVASTNSSPSEAEGAFRLWESNLSATQDLPDSPVDWLPSAWSRTTAVGDSLSQASEFIEDSSRSSTSVVVLLSDGQSNSGASPISIAEELASAETPVFAVGYGPVDGISDVSLVAVTLPNRVYRTDVLNGTLSISDQLPPGTPFTAELRRGDEVVWQQEFVGEGTGSRGIPFSLPIEPLFKAESAALPQGVEYATLPLKLSARLTTRVSEANLANNQREVFLSVASQKSRLLLVDGRSRWETRYLRNVFSRDPAWQIDTVLDHASVAKATENNAQDSHAQENDGSENPTPESAVVLPQTREELNRYNLIIVGDVEAAFWKTETLIWLSDFVQRGGGLIFIDGARQNLQNDGYASINSLLPIRWTNNNMDGTNDATPKRTELTSVGRVVEALKLSSDAAEDNDAIWQQLPSLQFVSAVEALPGSEVLVEAVVDKNRHPLLITRRFGAGRVLFVATDESWRWRYKVADLVHQRFWNQLARWSMRVPMSVQGEFVSLDTGPASIELGQSIEVQCSLRELNGDVATGRTASAVVRRDGQVIARIPLAAQTELPGAYAGEIRSLPAGDYQVQIEAAGYPREALEAASKFSIVAPQSIEMQQLTRNDVLLRQIADITGGEYVPEDKVDQLPELLRPMSGGRITQSATLLWQSYWWFVAAIILLVLEWILRKRSGLI